MAGNKNSGRKDKYTRQALVMEMKARDSNDQGMRLLARKVWALAEEGERWAVEFVRDTLDGKPAQVVAGDEDSPLEFIHRIEREIVSNAKNPDS